MADDARKPTPPARSDEMFVVVVVAVVVVLVLVVALVLDWLNPCTGRIIDPVACLARVLAS